MSEDKLSASAENNSTEQLRAQLARKDEALRGAARAIDDMSLVAAYREENRDANRDVLLDRVFALAEAALARIEKELG